MHRAEVFIGSGLGKGVGKTFIGIERLRFELLAGALYHSVWNVVPICPRHRRAGGDGQSRRREAEIIDRDLVTGRLVIVGRPTGSRGPSESLAVNGQECRHRQETRKNYGDRNYG